MNIYRTYIDVINFVKTDKKRYNVETNKEEQMDVDEDNQQELLLKDEHEAMFSDK